jgi:hypothetical protein
MYTYVKGQILKSITNLIDVRACQIVLLRSQKLVRYMRCNWGEENVKSNTDETKVLQNRDNLY